MSNHLGKRMFSNGNSGTVNPAGICTWACPPLCDEVSYTYCKCSNVTYETRGSTYLTNYNQMILNFRAPDFD